MKYDRQSKLVRGFFGNARRPGPLIAETPPLSPSERGIRPIDYYEEILKDEARLIKYRRARKGRIILKEARKRKYIPKARRAQKIVLNYDSSPGWFYSPNDEITKKARKEYSNEIKLNCMKKLLPPPPPKHKKSTSEHIIDYYSHLIKMKELHKKCTPTKCKCKAKDCVTTKKAPGLCNSFVYDTLYAVHIKHGNGICVKPKLSGKDHYQAPTRSGAKASGALEYLGRHVAPENIIPGHVAIFKGVRHMGFVVKVVGRDKRTAWVWLLDQHTEDTKKRPSVCGKYDKQNKVCKPRFRSLYFFRVKGS